MNLTYKTYATKWLEGLPIGNGRLAAMVWQEDSIDSDIVSLNHEWLWRGVHRNRDNEDVSSHLPEVRAEFLRGDFPSGNKLANDYFGGVGGTSGIKNRVDAYQPAGDLTITLKDTQRFISRQLDIYNGIAETIRATSAGLVTSQFLVHPSVNNCICHLESDHPFGAVLAFSRVEDAGCSEKITINGKTLRFDGAFDKGISYAVIIELETDGVVTPSENGFEIDNAKEILALINIATTAKGDDLSLELERYASPKTSWKELKKTHTAIFSDAMGKVEFSLGQDDETLDTEEKIKRVKQGQSQEDLMATFFDYGRYLLVCSSLCGELPANLQGKWNWEINPPWESDYHFDINIQMNYWMSEPCNMPQCSMALILYAESFVKHAKTAAKKLYGCRGIWLPIQTDCWGISTPESHGYAVWVGAAPWISQHFWNHFRYNGDITFLKDRAYPFFCEVAAFFEDYLIKDERGVYQVIPSQSPENHFEGSGISPTSLGISTAMDVELIYDVMGYAIESATILKVDEQKIEQWKQIRAHLPAFKIGTDGRLLEWDREYVEVEPGHRHLSHLYGLYPSDIFTPASRPQQYEAAIKSLDYRLSKGGGHTGWSRAWVSALSARLGRGNDMRHHLTAMIAEFATVSLLDLHPPKIFQIDGNLGAVAAIGEALCSCFDGEIHLLHALPDQWPNGKLKGIKAVGGHILDFAWENGRVTVLNVQLGFAGQAVICVNGKKIIVTQSGEVQI